MPNRKTLPTTSRPAQKAGKSGAKVGRPSDYSPLFVEAIENADPKLIGAATAFELCAIIGCHYTQLHRWMKDHPEFGEAVARVRARADDQVEAAMFRRSLGYTLDDVRTTTKDGKDGTEVSQTEAKVHIPPSEAAASFWLKNRRRDAWTDRKTVEITGDFADLVESFLPKED